MIGVRKATPVEIMRVINKILSGLREDGVMVYDPENPGFFLDKLNYNPETDEICFICKEMSS